MEAYQSTASASYYINSEVQLANTSSDLNNYFTSFINSHVDVASHNHTSYVASANNFVK